jgi:hypothetical protein
MWEWSENTSCQGPEHAHIDIKCGAYHKQQGQFISILHYHCSSGLLQHYEQMLEYMLRLGDACELLLDHSRLEKALTRYRNFSIFCELGVHYPSLLAMINRDNLHLLL